MREDTIRELKQYFRIEELVCQHTVDRLGSNAWDVLRTELLETLLVIRRDIIKRPMTVNNQTWHQRGFRCNWCDLVREKKGPYLSSHCVGAAFDASCKDMTAEQMRSAIRAAAHLLPCNIRMEDGVDWLHVDIYDKGQKVYMFRG